jgi:hypothetical protein
MLSASIRTIALAAWCVLAALTLGAVTPIADCDSPPCGATQVEADHAPHAIVAVGHAPHARQRGIRHHRTGSRQLSSSQSATVVPARLNGPASRMGARHVRVPARHLLLHLIAPRAPASTLS